MKNLAKLNGTKALSRMAQKSINGGAFSCPRGTEFCNGRCVPKIPGCEAYKD